MEPSVSVVIPCKNMGAFICDAVKSALGQSLAPHEIVVVDDGSTDTTLDALKSFGSLVRIVSGPGMGSAVARNLGILHSRGDFVAFLDADDMWLENKLKSQINQLVRSGDGQDFSFTDYVRGERPENSSQSVLSEYAGVSDGMVFPALLRENFVLTSSVLVSRRALGTVGLFNPALRGGQDYDLWLRLAKAHPFSCVRTPLVFYRRHDGAITRSVTYGYHIADLWEELVRQHRHVSPEDAAYIRSRAVEASIEAGKLAIRLQDIPMARRQFQRSRELGASVKEVMHWIALCGLPRPMIRAAQALKRRMTEPSRA